MQKDELIHLHSLLVEIKKYFEESLDAEEERFENYNSLEISPEHIHKSKTEHKHAIFVLGEELANEMTKDELSETGRIGRRMKELRDEHDD